jgi:hypothetical protein
MSYSNTIHILHTHAHVSNYAKQEKEGRFRYRSVGHERLHCAGAEATNSSEDHAMPPVTDSKTRDSRFGNKMHYSSDLDDGNYFQRMLIEVIDDYFNTSTKRFS